MQTEQSSRDEAVNYFKSSKSVEDFHVRLREVYHLVKGYCDDIPLDKCGETPKLICLRCMRKYPPVDCVLRKAGYFPLTIDYKFAKDVARGSITPATKLNEMHAQRFENTLTKIESFALVRVPKKDTDDPTATIANVKWRDKKKQ